MPGIVFPGNLFFFMLDTSGGITRTLQVDRVSGSFLYRNLSELWMVPEMAPELPSEYEAWSFLDNWYKTQGEALPGAWYRTGYNYFVEQIVEMQMAPDEYGNLQEQEIASIPTNVVMTYPRTISARVQTTNGTEQLALPLFGQGAKMKVYLGNGGEIIGMMGGSRDVQDSGLMVETLPAEVAWEKFVENPSLAIPEVSWVGDVITYTNVILGYYEQQYVLGQTELIPVWNFKANYFSKGVLLAENVDVYVPAAEEIMPPEVNILTPANGSTFNAGELISFTSSITGGKPPYLIEWNSSSDGYLGNQQNIVHTLGSEIKSSTVFQPTVSLQVIDANGMMTTQTISLNINPVLWIPLVNK